jgi:YidC/Oxa1 family membrane protein insertase
MGTDFQRTILWVFFGMSLFLLWDRWLVYTGKPSMFRDHARAAGRCADAARCWERRRAFVGPGGAARTGRSRRPVSLRSAVDFRPGRSQATSVVVETDRVRATIDPEGAVLSRVELLQSGLRRTG